jgi:hypothetical protein
MALRESWMESSPVLKLKRGEAGDCGGAGLRHTAVHQRNCGHRILGNGVNLRDRMYTNRLEGQYNVLWLCPRFENFCPGVCFNLEELDFCVLGIHLLDLLLSWCF